MTEQLNIRKHPLYSKWENIRQLCRKNKLEFYQKWNSYEEFYGYWIDKYKENEFIVRIDRNLGYTPDNCNISSSTGTINIQVGDIINGWKVLKIYRNKTRMVDLESTLDDKQVRTIRLDRFNRGYKSPDQIKHKRTKGDILNPGDIVNGWQVIKEYKRGATRVADVVSTLEFKQLRTFSVSKLLKGDVLPPDKINRYLPLPKHKKEHKLYIQWKSAIASSKLHNVEFYLEWLDYNQFFDYWINTYDVNLVFARKDQEKGFTPENCHFTDRKNVCKLIGKKLLGIKRGAKSKEDIQKQRETMLERYGVEYAGQIPSAKIKMKETMIKKYGVDHPSKSKEIIAKKKQNALNKYGMEHYSQTPEGREQAKKRAINSGLTTTYNGKTTEEAANEIGICRSSMNRRIQLYGAEKAFTMTKKDGTGIENIMKNFITSLNIPFENNKKIENRFTDILIESHKLIIECDGLYWHSDQQKTDKYYHRDKMRLYSRNGYRSLFFRENEIIEKFDIIQSMIKHRLGLSDRIYARKCTIEYISNKDIKLFMETNHLMGPGQGSAIVLKSNGEIVAGMQIINRKDYVDISRFATKQGINVIGGFSRLLKAIENKYNKDIHTFIDRRYGVGTYLKEMGFELKNEDISFMWTKDYCTVHRMKFPGNSGYEQGWSKIWDCGQAKYVKKAG